MTTNEKCPGCHQPFKLGDIVGIFRWPYSNSTETLKWHIRCHQDLYYREMDRLKAAAYKD